MKSFTLLLWLAFLLNSQGVVAQDESPVESFSRTAAFAQVSSNANNLTTGLYSGDVPSTEFRTTLVSITNDLYLSGFIGLAQLDAKIIEIDACLAAHALYKSNDSDLNKDNRRAKCNAAVNYSPLETAAPACTGTDKVLAGSQCCAGMVEGVSASLEAASAGSKSNQACGQHADCASKICNKPDDSVATGICTPTLSCFKTIPLNAECSVENPNCQAGVCRRQDYGVEGVSCKILAAVCVEQTECCSGKCASGKCQDKFICEMCLEEGATPVGKQQCCRGFIQGIDKACTLEMPPFILPSPQASLKRDGLWRQIASNLFSLTASAQEVGTPTAPPGGANTSQGSWVNDEALTEKQLDLIEGEVKAILNIKNKEVRKQELLKIYATRKQYAADNVALIKAGKNPGKVFTQEEYVKRYNIPAITPKERSNVEMCEFDTAKDNWLDSSNLLRNADLFVRSFETSYSGRGTQDMWHLLDASGKANPKNLYSRTKDLMSDIRENRYSTREQLKYLDLLVSCQCIYTFGPEKFSPEKQAFFYTQCLGQPENKICRDGEMREALKLPESAEQPYKDGVEFPNYVAMYMEKLQKMAAQGRQGVDDVDNIDSGAAGINHEEVLVRWLRLRSCNQIDVFMDTEKVETELQTIAEDINRAKKPVARLTSYWNTRLSQMRSGGVDKAIVKLFDDDKTKDSWYRGYVHTESKVHSWTKKTFKFLLFLILALLVVGLGAFGLIALGLAGTIAGGVLGVGLMLSGGSVTGGYNVVESFSKDFPNVIIEDRLVEKKSCGFLGLFYCKTFYRILHWPAFSNNPGIEGVFPWKKREERNCDGTHAAAVGYPGMPGNPCSGPFKGTMCARSFYRPLPDATIANKADFQPWKEVMADKTLMDPVMPEFFEENLNLDYKWVAEVNAGFKKGCAWAQALGKKKVVASDKAKFFPDFDKYIDGSANFKPQFQFTQERIDKYKAAVKKYALCRDLRECGALNYDGKNENPWGHGDIFCPADTSKPCSVESQQNAELFSNYVYQLHFNWRHMSGQSGIGYPLAYLENYYLSLLHNIRLLTTLSIRRGIELDDAFNRYAEDLAIRRGRYQISGDQYGLNMGANLEGRVAQNNVFRSFRSLGFPLSSEFVGLPAGGGLPRSGNATGQDGATGSALATGFELNVLNAARRTADRVAKDNKANLNFQKQIQGNAAAGKRLAAATKFFGKLNSPLSSVSGLARPGDNSSYSGVGGKVGTLNGSGSANTKNASGETEQSFGAVPSKNSASTGNSGSSSGAGSGAGTGSGEGDASSAFANAGANGSGDDSGANGGAGSDKDALSEAARKTGMKEGDLSNMLDAADKNRNGNLTGSANDSLFEKVSKAYMRNLERVLIKTKGAEKPAKKEEQKDPEKDEIKKIFNQ